MPTSCAKRRVVAVILLPDGGVSVGENLRESARPCPRVSMPSGTGYEECSACGQKCHAEVAAIQNAPGGLTHGGVLYLIGHHYCCDSCLGAMAASGITLGGCIP